MRLLLALLAITAILVGLWFVFSPQSPYIEPPPAEDTEAPVAFEWTLTDALIDGPQMVTLKQGTRVQLAFTSMTPTELHLHGYDITLALPEEERVVLPVNFVHAGRFELETHGARHQVVTTFLVEPQ